MLTLDEGIKESLDNIFGAILMGGLKKDTDIDMHQKAMDLRYCLPKFKATFRENVFYNQYGLFHSIIVSSNIPAFSVNQLKSLIRDNFSNIMDSPYIDMGLTSQRTINNAQLTEDEKVQIFTEDMVEELVRLSNRQVSQTEFDSACNMYIAAFKESFMFDTINQMALIMSRDGTYIHKTKKRRVFMQGSEDSQKYYRERMTILSSLEETGASRHVLVDEKHIEERREAKKTGNTTAILDYGIAEIDSVKKKMRRGNIIEAVGPPKGGKTTFITYLAERALAQGLNTAVWVLDGADEEWEDLITALIVRHQEAGAMCIDKSDIAVDDYESEEARSAVEAARQILASDPKRGRLSFIDFPGYVEDMEDILKEHYENVNPYDVLVIDSPINFQSMERMSKVETISKVYMNLRAFVSKKMKKKALVLLTAQLKQEVVDMLRKNPEADIDVTAGGESAETIRTPDQVIGLFSTKTERDNKQMKIFDVASRHQKSFNNCYIGCELGCGHFFSNPELNR